MQQIWGELPPDQRYKLAILCDLYMRGPAQELMEVIAGGIEEEGAPRRVLRLWQRMKGRNRAVALARDAEEQEAERFQYYYEYLAGL